MSNFVEPELLIHYVNSICPMQVRDIGSKTWFDFHHKLIRLSHQSILEASENREEEVKEALIFYDKLKVLVHEAYCVTIWKTRVLPILLEIDPNPPATYLIYTVLFHEGAVISLLDVALYHASSCEGLMGTALDLIDYCAQGVAQVIGLIAMGYLENESNVDVDESVLSELERQKRDLIYKIGMRCISILNYLADNMNALPLSAARRMVDTNDIPWLMVDILNLRPWQRHVKQGSQKYIDDKWVTINPDESQKVTKQEAQCWFCLRQLLFNKQVMELYEWTDSKRKHLGNCLGLLHENLLDQLPPLIDLKRHLSEVLMSAHCSPSSSSKSLLFEEVPQIGAQLLKEVEKIGGFMAIAQEQESIFLCQDKNKLIELAQCVTSAYDTDLLAELEERYKDGQELNEGVNGRKSPISTIEEEIENGNGDGPDK